MDRYCIYLRKSRKDDEAEARGEGETLMRHEKALLELARRQTIAITEIYREVVSGETIAARPVMQHLLSEVEQGMWAGVVVMEVERLARGDTSDQGTIAKAFKFTNTKIITPIKTFDPNNEYDEEFFEFALFMSRREYKIITRRMQRGRVASVEEGKYVANQQPYGYHRVKLEKEKGYTLREYAEQADIVRMIFEWYTDGEIQEDGLRKRLGVGLIVKRLNQLKIPAQKGGIWVSGSVRDILINPVYTGMIRWNWRPAKKKMTDGVVTVERPRSKDGDCILVNGLHTGIVDADVFARAQELMKQNPPRPIGERNSVKNPLAGLVYCGKCGRSMSRRPYNKNGYPDTLLCAVPECPNVSSHLSLVESRVIEALEEWLNDYRLKWNLDTDQSKKAKKNPQLELSRKAINKIDADIKTLDSQISRTHDLLEQGIYDTNTYLDRSRELGERKKQAELDRTALEKDLELEELREESKISIVPKVERLIETYHDLPTPAAKNDMLKEVLEKVVYTKEQGGRWHNPPDNFEIKLFPRLPAAHKTF